MSKYFLIFNAGSSSLKFSLFEHSGLQAAYSGEIDAIPTHPKFRVRRADGSTGHEEDGFAPGFSTALRKAISWCEKEGLTPHIVGFGHRVVHGGTTFTQPVRITSPITAQLHALTSLAPLHQPYNMEVIDTLAHIHPEIPQVACFDTAFHRTQDIRMQHYALPPSYASEGVLRYGFHGLSYEYIASILPEHAGERARGRVIVAHLGNGASMCAMNNLQSVGTTMGFTTLDGLMMGTRCGTIDPGILLYLLAQGMPKEALERLLYKESGLKGVSGISHDIRDLLNHSSPEAAHAIDLFCYNAARQLAGLLPCIGGLDILVFTAGIGTWASKIRAGICQHLSWLGIVLDEEQNNTNAPCISRPDSPVAVYRIPTNEELVIARAAAQLVDA